ncbi:MAG: T9SS type A sorting domain-containing protein [Bacteroidota bacterium]|nr:T9SS type A sorting domain-containing protein [Bacteroidota bacterium]
MAQDIIGEPVQKAILIPLIGLIQFILKHLISVELLNCDGQVIEVKRVNADKIDFVLNHLSKGLYIIKVITVNDIVYERVIIE